MSGDLPRGWKPNTLGTCPGIAAGKRVKVKLRNGMICGAAPVNSDTKAGWPADAEAAGNKGPAMNWSLTGSPADVIEWDFV